MKIIKLNESVSESEKYFNKYMLLEASLSNIYRRLSEPTQTVAIISPYRGEFSEKENRERMIKLKADVRNLKLGFNQLISRWVEDGEAFDEQSLFIPNISYDDAFSLSKKYNQSSFIFKDDNGLREICTTPFEDYNAGDVVRTFYTDKNHVFNFKDAEEVFSKRVSGPGSKLVKGSNTAPFQFKVTEVLEVHPPRPSYHQTRYTYNRIL